MYKQKYFNLGEVFKFIGRKNKGKEGKRGERRKERRKERKKIERNFLNKASLNKNKEIW